MKTFKRIASALGVLFLSVAFAALVTYLTTPEEDRPDIVELTESFDADGGRERAIDWDSLPSEVVAWIEVPGTSIDEPIVQALSLIHILSIIEGAFIESGEAGQSILYYSVESEQTQNDGITATLAVSDSMTGDEELTVAVFQTSSEGERTLTCDKLSCAYVLEEVQATAITVTEADERLYSCLLYTSRCV